jgi:hypothetical protein
MKRSIFFLVVGVIIVITIVIVWRWKNVPPQPISIVSESSGSPSSVEKDLEEVGESSEATMEEVGYVEESVVETSPKQEEALSEWEEKAAFTEDILEDSDISESALEYSVEERLVSWGYESRKRRDIDTVIIHSSYNSLGGDEYDADAIIAIYRDYGVAAHYMIDRDGVVLRLVREKDVAYHAGVSTLPDGRTNVNSVSVGIELIGNLGDGFTRDQYDALNALLFDIQSRYEIRYVLGHSDIAPGRKTDPWNFDWEKVVSSK